MARSCQKPWPPVNHADLATASLYALVILNASPISTAAAKIVLAQLGSLRTSDGFARDTIPYSQTALTFLLALVVFTAVLLVAAVPVLVLARKHGLRTTTRRFLIAIGAIGMLSAVISAGSERLVDKCKGGGSANCVDPGAAGFQALLVAGFVVTALFRAVSIYQD